MWAELPDITSNFLIYCKKRQGVLEMMLAGVCLRGIGNCLSLAYRESWLLWDKLHGKGTRDTTICRRGGRHAPCSALCARTVPCFRQGGTATNQSKWVQHIRNSSQTRDISHCEITYEASEGKCLLQGRSGLQQHSEVSNRAACKLSSWCYLLMRNLQRCNRLKRRTMQRLNHIKPQF